MIAAGFVLHKRPTRPAAEAPHFFTVICGRPCALFLSACLRRRGTMLAGLTVLYDPEGIRQFLVMLPNPCVHFR